jgi:hypothetical protein
MATTGPQKLKHPRPPSGLVGWAAAWDRLHYIESDLKRNALSKLIRQLGVQGAPAMEYAARYAMWITKLSNDAPVARKALGQGVAQHIEKRVRQELAGTDHKLFGRLRG